MSAARPLRGRSVRPKQEAAASEPCGTGRGIKEAS
jgi:hypothetical protein